LLTQSCIPLQVPQFAVRRTPQLSAPVTASHVLPRREQNVALDSLVQPQTPGVPPPPQVFGVEQAGQPTDWPQLLRTAPHFSPWHVVPELSGVHPQTPLTPPPPHVCPVPGHEVEHCTVWPQLFVVGPHLPLAQVVVIASSVHVLQRPVPELHPKGHGVSEPHWPFEPQVCAVDPLHRWVFGGHTPPHLPVAGSQMFVHATAAAYMPSTPQRFVEFPVQASVPGTHSPAHLPVAASQMKGHAFA
jgi:hypothetical protein